MSKVIDAIRDTTIEVESVYKAQSEAFGLLDYSFLLDIINKNHSRKILDVGTGDGSFLLNLAEKAPHVKFDAIDLNKNLIETGIANCKKLGFNINFQHANFGENYTGSNYDLIMARFAIEHIEQLKDIHSFVATSHEKLNLNGWLVIIRPLAKVVKKGDERNRAKRVERKRVQTADGCEPRNV